MTDAYVVIASANKSESATPIEISNRQINPQTQATYSGIYDYDDSLLLNALPLTAKDSALLILIDMADNHSLHYAENIIHLARRKIDRANGFERDFLPILLVGVNYKKLTNTDELTASNGMDIASAINGLLISELAKFSKEKNCQHWSISNEEIDMEKVMTTAAQLALAATAKITAEKKRLYTNAMKIITTYKRIRETDTSEGWTVFGGYTKEDKLAAIQALADCFSLDSNTNEITIKNFDENTLSENVKKALYQGRLHEHYRRIIDLGVFSRHSIGSNMLYAYQATRVTGWSGLALFGGSDRQTKLDMVQILIGAIEGDCSVEDALKKQAYRSRREELISALGHGKLRTCYIALVNLGILMPQTTPYEISNVNSSLSDTRTSPRIY